MKESDLLTRTKRYLSDFSKPDCRSTCFGILSRPSRKQEDTTMGRKRRHEDEQDTPAPVEQDEAGNEAPAQDEVTDESDASDESEPSDEQGEAEDYSDPSDSD